jgi:hemerythrin
VGILKWEKSFELGMAQFDEHHKHLVALLNDTCNCAHNGGSKDQLESIIDKLFEYTRYHFSAEEQWMDLVAYDGLLDHVAEHDKFTSMVEHFQTEFHNGDTQLTTELLFFLGDWLFDHILVSDAQYAQLASSPEW